MSILTLLNLSATFDTLDHSILLARFDDMFGISDKAFELFSSYSSDIFQSVKKLHWLPVKERILFKIATFAFRFFDCTLPPYLSSCLSVYTPSRTLRSSSDEKNLSCARWRFMGFSHRSFSFRRPLSGTTFLPTSDTAVPSHSSKLRLKPSCSLLPSLSYLDPLEDLFLLVLFSWTAVVRVADLSLKGRVRE